MVWTLEGGAEAVVTAPGGGRGDEVLVDSKAEGWLDPLFDLDEGDAGGEGAVAEQGVKDVDVGADDVQLKGVGAVGDASSEEGDGECGRGDGGLDLGDAGPGQVGVEEGQEVGAILDDEAVGAGRSRMATTKG